MSRTEEERPTDGVGLSRRWTETPDPSDQWEIMGASGKDVDQADRLFIHRDSQFSHPKG